MNIFVLDKDPKVAAQMHLDRHVVKMIIEYAQLLSTAHRLRDGRHEEHITPQGRKKQFWLLSNEKVEAYKDVDGTPRLGIANPVCYSLSHQNHPCAIWCRETDTNYNWLFELLRHTSLEYQHRYGKIHKTWRDTRNFLLNPPKNIPAGDLTPFPQAMPQEYKHEDPVVAYQNYYLGSKAEFARWTNRPAPTWFKQGFKDYDDSHFQRTTALA